MLDFITLNDTSWATHALQVLAPAQTAPQFPPTAPQSPPPPPHFYKFKRFSVSAFLATLKSSLSLSR